MAVAGIDFSSRAVDVVWLSEDDDAATWFRYPLVGQDAFDRTRQVRAQMPRASVWDNTVAVGIEDPRGYNAGALYRVQGAILSCLPRSVLVHPLPPSVWRKTVGLPGNASKADVMARVHRTSALRVDFRTGLDWPQDACDAYCIALATRTLLQYGEAVA